MASSARRPARLSGSKPSDLVDGAAGIGLLQNRYDFGLRELRLAHGDLLAQGDYSASRFSF